MGEESLPVFAAPVLRLHLGSYADRDDGMTDGGGQRIGGPGMFMVSEMKAPA